MDVNTFRLFDKVNILTKGGPANSTATINQYIYQYDKGLKGRLRFGDSTDHESNRPDISRSLRELPTT